MSKRLFDKILIYSSKIYKVLTTFRKLLWSEYWESGPKNRWFSMSWQMAPLRCFLWNQMWAKVWELQYRVLNIWWKKIETKNYFRGNRAIIHNQLNDMFVTSHLLSSSISRPYITQQMQRRYGHMLFLRKS